jgi:hypothetical protein
MLSSDGDRSGTVYSLAGVGVIVSNCNTFIFAWKAYGYLTLQMGHNSLIFKRKKIIHCLARPMQ